MKRLMSLYAILKPINLNNKVLVSFKSILTIEINVFKKLLKKFLRFKSKLDYIDPDFIDHFSLGII